ASQSMPQSQRGSAAAWCIIRRAYSALLTTSLVWASRGMVRCSDMSLVCSASVNLGSVAKACQYLRAAFAPRSEGASAEACPEGSARMVVARHSARSMSGTSLCEGWDGKGSVTAAGFAVSVEQVGRDRGQCREARGFLKGPGKRGHFRQIQAPSDVPPGGDTGGVLAWSGCDRIRGWLSGKARDR